MQMAAHIWRFDLKDTPMALQNIFRDALTKYLYLKGLMRRLERPQQVFVVFCLAHQAKQMFTRFAVIVVLEVGVTSSEVRPVEQTGAK